MSPKKGSFLLGYRCLHYLEKKPLQLEKRIKAIPVFLCSSSTPFDNPFLYWYKDTCFHFHSPWWSIPISSINFHSATRSSCKPSTTQICNSIFPQALLQTYEELPIHIHKTYVLLYSILHHDFSFALKGSISKCFRMLKS